MVEISGLYGEQLVKALKLTERMVEAITNGGAYGTAPNTTKALISRGLMSDVAGSYGNLTTDGEHVQIHLSDTDTCATCEAAALTGGATQVSYGEPMEVADYDRMNADAERADIDGENAHEAAAMAAEEFAAQVASADMHDDLLAELFPGDDDPQSTYAECKAQLMTEILCCHECNASGVCDDHASVEAWVRSGYVFPSPVSEHASEAAILAAYDAGVAAQSKSVEATTVSPWEASTSKRKRHARR